MRILLATLLTIMVLEAVIAFHNRPCGRNEAYMEARSSNCGEQRCSHKVKRCKRDARSGCFCENDYYRDGGPSGPCVIKKACKNKKKRP
uniref:TIL domain containing protein n=1 Tax=Rhipicephalus zambeziensis TaxID=60191 RepID=A0A224YFE6_9ACAR